MCMHIVSEILDYLYAVSGRLKDDIEKLKIPIDLRYWQVNRLIAYKIEVYSDLHVNTIGLHKICFFFLSYFKCALSFYLFLLYLCSGLV